MGADLQLDEWILTGGQGHEHHRDRRKQQSSHCDSVLFTQAGCYRGRRKTSQQVFDSPEARVRLRELVDGKLVFVGWSATGNFGDFYATAAHPRTPGVVPRVGLKPNTPQWLAGTRMEPPPSVAWATGSTLAATAAAAPPLEPPVL